MISHLVGNLRGEGSGRAGGSKDKGGSGLHFEWIYWVLIYIQ